MPGTEQRTFVSYIDRTREFYAAQGYDKPYRWARNAQVPFAKLAKPLSECRATPRRERIRHRSRRSRGVRRLRPTPSSPATRRVRADEAARMDLHPCRFSFQDEAL